MTRLSDALGWRERAEPHVAEQWDAAGWDLDAAYAVSGDAGMSWRIVGPEIEPDGDTEWSGYERATGRVCMVMIGDDAVFTFDPAEVRAIDDLAYCASCGQIGCTADGRDRSDDGTDDDETAARPAENGRNE
jgi:hypothetical protein